MVHREKWLINLTIWRNTKKIFEIILYCLLYCFINPASPLEDESDTLIVSLIISEGKANYPGNQFDTPKHSNYASWVISITSNFDSPVFSV